MKNEKKYLVTESQLRYIILRAINEYGSDNFGDEGFDYESYRLDKNVSGETTDDDTVKFTAVDGAGDLEGNEFDCEIIGDILCLNSEGIEYRAQLTDDDKNDINFFLSGEYESFYCEAKSNGKSFEIYLELKK